MRWTLGHYLSITGRFDQALTELEKACALAPGAVGAFHNLVTAKRVTEADRALIDRMTATLNSGRLHDVARMTAHYALGKAHDDLGDYARAIHHFDAANKLERGMTLYDRGHLSAWVDLLIARSTPVIFVRMPRSARPTRRRC